MFHYNVPRESDDTSLFHLNEKCLITILIQVKTWVDSDESENDFPVENVIREEISQNSGNTSNMEQYNATSPKKNRIPGENLIFIAEIIEM